MVDEPAPDCGLCPRLVAYRAANRRAYPGWHHDPVASFGALDAQILVVGLAPGLKGANRTGRPFTGDYAGDLLYATLSRLGLAQGRYGASADDGYTLVNCRITNAARCAPPANKVTPAEFAACRPFLAAEIKAMPNLKGVLCLGRESHDQVLSTLGLRKSAHPFGHGAVHRLEFGLVLTDSYHCSRYNTNTRRLTEAMFVSAVEALLAAV
ncbi:uracil-DNA glycosylase [Paramagnetospirillum kuznetsovii]|uniref:Type-5 uracil-DNA glycosylase n=1 Tax=Paramagnetospirillum kuznetsovii TaxID=2053833 RepID=A0A364P027_9PROT|nr:uracil-DNA glycosylase [Paramagnetospirillum kuznetsovii]RAU22475.1 uracil-DNA glycosylase [Paramagnetospirillum kuznetsovii]